MELSFLYTIPIWYKGATAPFGKRTCETVWLWLCLAYLTRRYRSDERLDTLSNLLIAFLIFVETTLDLVFISSILITSASVKDLQLGKWIELTLKYTSSTFWLYKTD
jgi:hypothetical protein